MICAAKLQDHIGATVGGQFRVSHVAMHTSTAKEATSVRIDLDDYTGTASAYGLGHLIDPAAALNPGDLVEAIVIPRLDSGLPEARLIGVQSIEVGDARNVAALMPRSECPDAARGALRELVDIVEAMDHQPLRRCLNHFFNAYWRQILARAASRHWTDGYPGSLLVHGVELTQTATELARQVYGDPVRIQVIQAAALIHHLGWDFVHPGAVLAARRRTRRWDLHVGHVVADEPMEQLRRDWPAGGWLLSEILASIYDMPARPRPLCQEAKVVWAADILVRGRQRRHRVPALRLIADNSEVS